VKTIREIIETIRHHLAVWDIRFRYGCLRLGRRWTAQLREARLKRFPESKD